ncbi:MULTISPECIES: ElaB/YgaM/YqjD family protein [Aquaspirillum]|uniref:DUF883 family protein n=1 Tax=Aquaspirillum serpens TaxID=190 RepID=UPI0003B6A1E2|nr:DUF883 family protein [Aquaspirillum serpens]
MSDNSLSPEKQNLLAEVKDVIQQTETILQATAGEGNEQAKALKQKLAANLSVAKDRLIAAEEVALARAKATARATDQYVHEHPWKALGIGAAVGFLLGMLVSRR